MFSIMITFITRGLSLSVTKWRGWSKMPWYMVESRGPAGGMLEAGPEGRPWSTPFQGLRPGFPGLEREMMECP